MHLKFIHLHFHRKWFCFKQFIMRVLHIPKHKFYFDTNLEVIYKESTLHRLYKVNYIRGFDWYPYTWIYFTFEPGVLRSYLNMNSNNEYYKWTNIYRYTYIIYMINEIIGKWQMYLNLFVCFFSFASYYGIATRKLVVNEKIFTWNPFWFIMYVLIF